MPKKSASPADIFLNAASQRVNDKEQARLAKEAEEKRQADERRQAQEREARTLKKAFPEYYKKIEPLLKAMEDLPPKDGDEFFIRADLRLGEHYKTKVPTKSIHVWVIYSRETNEQHGPDGEPWTHSLAIDRKGTLPGERDDIDLALNGKSTLKLELDTDETGKVTIKSHTYIDSYTYAPNSRASGAYRGSWREYSCKANHAEHATIGGFAEALGKWVQDTAPERLSDIAAVLGRGEAKIPTERMAVSKPIKFASKPSA